MNNTFKKAFAGIIAVASLSLCTISNFANAESTQSNDTLITLDTSSSTRGTQYYTLRDKNLHNIEGSFEGDCYVTVYANFSSSVKINYYFNGAYAGNYTFSTGSPSQTLHVPSNKTCTFKIASYYGTSTNPATGYVNIY